jgi:hypothetical protein
VERKLYSVRDFMTAHRMGRTRFYEELASGRLRAVKMGRKTMIRAEDAAAWAAALPVYTTERAREPLTDESVKALVEADV